MFVCKECQAQAPRWQGRCSHCGAWGALTATVPSKTGTEARAPPQPVALADIRTDTLPRRATGYAELDRVLGDGAVPGGVVLVGGEPGIGKSTLLLAMCARAGGDALYVAGEEAPEQIGGEGSTVPWTPDPEPMASAVFR